jgi:hypothetical protein
LPVRVGDKSGEYTRKPVCRPGASRLPPARSECDSRDTAIEEDQMNTRPLPTTVPTFAENGDRLLARLAAPAALVPLGPALVGLGVWMLRAVPEGEGR